MCGASRHIQPEAFARLVGWSIALEHSRRGGAARTAEEGREGRGGGEPQAVGSADESALWRKAKLKRRGR